jgi:hypothetical protein
MVEATAGVVALGDGETARTVRPVARAQARGGAGAGRRGPQASDLEGFGHGPGVGSDPGGPTLADRGHAHTASARAVSSGPTAAWGLSCAPLRTGSSLRTEGGCGPRSSRLAG